MKLFCTKMILLFKKKMKPQFQHFTNKSQFFCVFTKSHLMKNLILILFFSLFHAGYGNTTPTTELGKVVTIFYAIIGMPLFLLYLSNIGNLLLFDASDDHSTFNTHTHNRHFDRTKKSSQNSNREWKLSVFFEIWGGWNTWNYFN